MATYVVKDGQLELSEAVSVSLAASPSALAFVVPAGFKPAQHANPWLARVFAPKGGQADTAFIVHDFLMGAGLVDRRVAEVVLYARLKKDGCGWWRSIAITVMTELFGRRWAY